MSRLTENSSRCRTAKCIYRLRPEINASQHNPLRDALELSCLMLASHSGRDALAQAGELSFALGGPGAHARRKRPSRVNRPLTNAA